MGGAFLSKRPSMRYMIDKRGNERNGWYIGMRKRLNWLEVVDTPLWNRLKMNKKVKIMSIANS